MILHFVARLPLAWPSRIAHRTLALLLIGALTACTPSRPTLAPSALASVESTSQAWVAAANPYAVEAGLEVLARGGNAVDAAIAVQTVLGLVEPQSSGIGGGAFMLYYDASTRRITSFNGRETAPAAARPDMFLDESGEPLPRDVATMSGRAVGVPGVMRLLELAHEQFGQRPWSEAFEPAIRLAENGFEVPRRLGWFLNSGFPQANAPDIRKLFSRADGSPLQAGDRFRNPAYAQTLRQLASGGASAMYEGPLAEAIVTRTRAEPLGGQMTLQDLAQYRPERNEPLCRTYRVRLVCVPPAPSSGVGLLQLLALLEHTDAAERGPQDPEAWFAFAQASRIMYADRDRYVADPRFVAVPVEELLDPEYVAERAKLIGKQAGPTPSAGALPVQMPGPDATREAAGTSHFVIIDERGNVVSMTTTVETVFGTGRVVGGFVLNNQLTDFSPVPREGDRPAANAVAGGKRPRSSMAPVMVLDADRMFFGALGSPGGNAILAYNGKTLLATLGWGLDLQQAIALPNLIARGDRFGGETSKFPQEVLEGLAARGVSMTPGHGEESGLHGVMRNASGVLVGGADPRREGAARTLTESN